MSYAAQEQVSPLLTQNMEFWDFILLVISLFVLFSWILSIIFILYWWLLLVLSWGKEDKIKPAINTIRYAVLWLIITVISIFAFPILWWLLWIDVETYAKPARILERIQQIWTDIFWATSSEYKSVSNWSSSNWTSWSAWSSNFSPSSSADSIPDDFSDL